MWPRAASLWSMMSTSSVPTIGRESTAVEEKVVVATAKVAAPQARATLVRSSHHPGRATSTKKAHSRFKASPSWGKEGRA